MSDPAKAVYVHEHVDADVDGFQIDERPAPITNRLPDGCFFTSPIDLNNVLIMVRLYDFYHKEENKCIVR